MAIPITEEFNDRLGRYDYYDSGDTQTNLDLQSRQHTDLRAFTNLNVNAPFRMYRMVRPMSQLNAFTMSSLDSGTNVPESEGWTVGTVGADTTVGKRPTLRVAVGAGATVTTQSTMEAVDLSGYDADASLVLSCPSFPATSLDLTQCRLEIVQGATTVQLPFPTNLTNGNRAISWPISALATVLNPDTVRIRLKATSATTVVIAALRVIASEWTATSLDMNTLAGRLRPIVDRDGSIPVAAFPKLWRADKAADSGIADPRPVNAKLAVVFNTGSQTANNQISLFYRGRREDFLTQLDLDGTDDGTAITKPLYGENQFTLGQRNRQPDYGQAVYDPRPQMDLEDQLQSNLDAQWQAGLERIADSISAAWIEVRLRWGVANQLIVRTTETQNDDEQFIFTLPALTSNTEYIMLSDVEDNEVRVRVLPVLSDGAIDYAHVVLDTTAIRNEFTFARRRGRIGWDITLGDGDAYIDSIRPRGLVYGEIITNNFESLTPVDGARLTVSATEDIIFIPETGFYNSASLAPDTYNSQSPDGSVKVTAPILGGIQTDPIAFEDFNYTEIVFDLWYPAEALASGNYARAYLLNELGYLIALPLPAMTGNRWQTLTIPLVSISREQTGAYRFVLMQEKDTATWWIDNLYVRRQAVTFAGRATRHDPWGREAGWTTFRHLINSEKDGVLFPKRDSWVQVRGQTLVHEASIDKMFIRPKYAELGRMVWNG
jgi:hypothetical protein